jgi:putative nucleotidyltransferase with HDIG domain
MNNTKHCQISLLELINCLSESIDLLHPILIDHHKKVTYMALKIGEQMKLSDYDLKRVLKAGLLHDIGALSLQKRIDLLTLETEYAFEHAKYSADFLEGYPPLEDIVEVIRYHHVPWNHGEGSLYEGSNVDELSHLIHLADRIVVLIDTNMNILDQYSYITQQILNLRGDVFVPEIVDAFMNLSLNENIWLDLTNKISLDIISSRAMSNIDALNMDEVVGFAKIIANVIDSQSIFTRKHSVRVAKTAQKLADLMGFSQNECRMMLISGYVHDLGKLTVGTTILDKHSTLNEEEINIIRSHPYYTYRLLSTIRGFETITLWASLHHEKLDGSGYPFHLKSADIPLGARILVISDVFTALNESRPHRNALSKVNIIKLMRSMVDDGIICTTTFSTLLYNYDILKKVSTEEHDD